MKIAEPFLVNLLIFVPIVLLIIWGKRGINISKRGMIVLIIFSIGFGFVEAAGIVFLRGANNFLPQQMHIKEGAINLSEAEQQAFLVERMFTMFYRVEFIREIATMIMIISISIAVGKGWAERFIIFLWIFGIWDISYYIFLRILIGWPNSFLSYDFLFLVPVPWYGQVWYPLLVSGMTLLVIIYLSVYKRGVA